MTGNVLDKCQLRALADRQARDSVVALQVAWVDLMVDRFVDGSVDKCTLLQAVESVIRSGMRDR